MDRSGEEMPAAALYRVDMKITSATELKNVNWRGNRQLRPYVVVWVDKETKHQTYAATSPNDGSYSWANQTLFIPTTTCTDETILHIQILHQLDTNDDKKTKPNVGTKQIKLLELFEDMDLSRQWRDCTFSLERESGRPQGEVDIRFRMMHLGPEEEVDGKEPEYLGIEKM